MDLILLILGEVLPKPGVGRTLLPSPPYVCGQVTSPFPRGAAGVSYSRDPSLFLFPARLPRSPPARRQALPPASWLVPHPSLRS